MAGDHTQGSYARGTGEGAHRTSVTREGADDYRSTFTGRDGLATALDSAGWLFFRTDNVRYRLVDKPLG